MAPPSPRVLGDAWDWSIDAVIDYICGPASLYYQQFGRDAAGLQRLREQLGANDVSGKILLGHVSRSDLVAWGITSLGRRCVLEETILGLRRGSAKFREWARGDDVQPAQLTNDAGSDVASLRHLFSSAVSAYSVGSSTPRPTREFSLPSSDRVLLEQTNGAAQTGTELLKPETPAATPEEHGETVAPAQVVAPLSSPRALQGREPSVEQPAPSGSEDLMPSSTIPAKRAHPQSPIPRNNATVDASTRSPQESVVTSAITLRDGEEAIVDANGKRRRRMPLSGALLQPQSPESPTSTAQALRSGQDSPTPIDHFSKGYLGTRALPVDDLFYGPTPFDTQIIHPDFPREQERRALLQRPQPGQALAPVQIELGLHPDTSVPLAASAVFNIQGSILSGDGQRQYVNRRITQYLKASICGSPTQLRNDMRQVSGVIPYNDWVVEHTAERRPASCTIVKNGLAIRARRSEWRAADDQGISPLEAHLQDDPKGLYANFDKYFAEAEEERSEDGISVEFQSDEESLDSQTKKEMEAEALERTKAPPPTKLEKAEVKAAIQQEIANIAAAWRERKLPRLEFRAYTFWREARSISLRAKMSQTEAEVGRFEEKLFKLTEGLLENEYNTAEEVQRSCGNCEVTVEDLEEHRWRLDVLKRQNPPAKPPKRQAKPAKKAPTRKEPLEADAEEISSEDSDFVEGDADTNSLPDNELAPDASVIDAPINSVAPAPEEQLVEYPRLPQEDSELPLPDEPMLDAEPVDTGDAERPVDEADPEDGEMEDVLPTAGGPFNEESDNAKDSEDPGSPPERLSPRTVLRQHAGIQDPSEAEALSEDSQDSLAPKNYEKGRSQVKPSAMDTRRSSKSQAEPVDLVPASPPLPLIDGDEGVEDASDGEANSDVEPTAATRAPWPRVDNIRGIKALSENDMELLCEEQDHRRVLTWIVSRANPEARIAVTRFSDGKNSNVVFVEMPAALAALIGHGQKLRHLEAAESEGCMQIAYWLVVWHACWLPPDNGGLRKQDVDAAMKLDADDFGDYYGQLIEILWLCSAELERSLQKGASRKDQYFFKDKHDLSSEAEAEEMHANLSGKKKGRLVQQSQEGVDLRKAAELRAAKMRRRRALLQKNMPGGGGRGEQDGAAVVNPMKKKKEEFIWIDPHIANRIHPHQVHGVQFMWGEAVGMQGGCLLAHTMGLGKTMQCITLLVALASAAQSPNERISKQILPSFSPLRALILCPPALVENWFDELLMWNPPASPIAVDHIRKVTQALRPEERVYELREWGKHAGILLISYSMFRRLVLNPVSKTTGKTPIDAETHTNVKEILCERPNIVIADEAHLFKSNTSGLYQAVHSIDSKSRIALTGSPLSNHLEEYYSILNWAQQGYLGSLPEFRSYFVQPITRGLYDQKDMKYSAYKIALRKLAVLKKNLGPKVQRADYGVIHSQMPGKREFVIRLSLKEVQKACYEKYIASVRSTEETRSQTNLWACLALLTLLCAHPHCFHQKLIGNDNNQYSETAVAEAQDEETTKLSRDDQKLLNDIDLLLSQPVEAVDLDKQMLQEQKSVLGACVDLGSVEHSSKIEILLEIIGYAKGAGDKVLVFSGRLAVLHYVQEQLKKQGIKCQVMDGSTDASSRPRVAKAFNQGGIDVMLISTRAGGTGLNLQAANRVVILDYHFNPMIEQQAIGRSYRIGQVKPVFVYRLVIGGSFEEQLLSQALFKMQLSLRVVDEKDFERQNRPGFSEYLHPPEETVIAPFDDVMGRDPLVLDRLLANRKEDKVVRAIHEMESFLKEEKYDFTPEERAAIDLDYEDFDLRRKDPEEWARRNQWSRAHNIILAANGHSSGPAPNSGAQLVQSTPAPAPATVAGQAVARAQEVPTTTSPAVQIPPTEPMVPAGQAPPLNHTGAPSTPFRPMTKDVVNAPSAHSRTLPTAAPHQNSTPEDRVGRPTPSPEETSNTARPLSGEGDGGRILRDIADEILHESRTVPSGRSGLVPSEPRNAQEGLPDPTLPHLAGNCSEGSGPVPSEARERERSRLRLAVDKLAEEHEVPMESRAFAERLVKQTESKAFWKSDTATAYADSMRKKRLQLKTPGHLRDLLETVARKESKSSKASTPSKQATHAPAPRDRSQSRSSRREQSTVLSDAAPTPSRSRRQPSEAEIASARTLPTGQRGSQGPAFQDTPRPRSSTQRSTRGDRMSQMSRGLHQPNSPSLPLWPDKGDPMHEAARRDSEARANGQRSSARRLTRGDRMAQMSRGSRQSEPLSVSTSDDEPDANAPRPVAPAIDPTTPISKSNELNTRQADPMALPASRIASPVEAESAASRPTDLVAKADLAALSNQSSSSQTPAFANGRPRESGRAQPDAPSRPAAAHQGACDGSHASRPTPSGTNPRVISPQQAPSQPNTQAPSQASAQTSSQPADVSAPSSHHASHPSFAGPRGGGSPPRQGSPSGRARPIRGRGDSRTAFIARLGQRQSLARPSTGQGQGRRSGSYPSLGWLLDQESDRNSKRGPDQPPGRKQ